MAFERWAVRLSMTQRALRKQQLPSYDADPRIDRMDNLFCTAMPF
jgi:hypothetical protein